MLVKVPRRTANVRDLDETKTVPRNTILYTIQMRKVTTIISRVKCDRSMITIFGGPDDIRTITFSKTVRMVRPEAFYKTASLRAALLNEGLEVLGTDEY